MKRLLALLAGGLGLGALLRRRRPALSATPAEDLRAKLEAAKGAAAAPEAIEPADEVPAVESRRADVHARARQAIDDLGETET
jgi:hypothetical protein